MSKNHSKLSHLTQPSNPKIKNNPFDLAHSYLSHSTHSDFFAQKSIRFAANQSQRCKVIKLIGDKQNNIQEIIAQINCFCGSKQQIKNILKLLMNKIYKLREERNSLKQQLQRCEKQIKKFKDKNSVGINTEDTNFKINQQVFQISTSENAMTDRIQQKAKIQKLQQMFKTEELESLTFHREFNQTNLLQQSEVKAKIIEDDQSLLYLQQCQIDGRKVLGQNNGQSQNRLRQFSYFLKANKFDINTLQSYIEKINCAKEIGNYQLRKRNRDLF